MKEEEGEPFISTAPWWREWSKKLARLVAPVDDGEAEVHTPAPAAVVVVGFAAGLGKLLWLPLMAAAPNFHLHTLCGSPTTRQWRDVTIGGCGEAEIERDT